MGESGKKRKNGRQILSRCGVIQVTSDPLVAVSVETRPQRAAEGEGPGAGSLRVSMAKALSVPTDLQGRVSGQQTRRSQAPGEEEVREAPRGAEMPFQDWREADRRRQHTQI